MNRMARYALVLKGDPSSLVTPFGPGSPSRGRLSLIGSPSKAEVNGDKGLIANSDIPKCSSGVDSA